MTISVQEVALKGMSQTWTVNLSTDPVAGDVIVIVASGANNSTPRTLNSVSGLGTSSGDWAIVEATVGSQPSIHVATYTAGADLSAGTITLTFSSSRFGIGRVYLIRGMAGTPTVSVDLSAVRTSGTSSLSGPTVSVDSGDVIINALATNASVANTTWTTTGWTFDPQGALEGNASPVHAAGTVYRVPTSAASVSSSATSGVSSNVRIGSVRVRTGVGSTTGSASLTGALGTVSAAGVVPVSGAGSLAGPLGALSAQGFGPTTGGGSTSGPLGTLSAQGAVVVTGAGGPTGPLGSLSADGAADDTSAGSLTALGPVGTLAAVGVVVTTGGGNPTGLPGAVAAAGDAGGGFDGANLTGPIGVLSATGTSDAEDVVATFDFVTVEDLLYVELTAAADIDVAVPILSEKHPSPVLSEALPAHQAWADYTPTTSVVGYAHLWVDGVDITYFRGKPTLVRNWTKEAPFGDKTAKWEMPQLDPWDVVGEGDLSFIRKGARVVIGIVDDATGEIARKWSGFYHSRTKGFDSAEDYVFEAHGTMWAAMSQAIEPVPYQEPVDIGILIPRLLNRMVGKPFHEIPQELTGLPTRYRGARDEPVWRAVQNILAKDGWTADGRQWTLRQVAEDEFRLVLKSAMSTIAGTVAWANPGVDFDLTVDEDSRVDGVFCRWVTKGGGESANVYYPGLEILDGLPYPNADAGDFLNLGATDAGTTSGTGVSDLQRKMIAEGFADGLRVTGTITAAWVEAVREAQHALNITVDGSVGPQTWTAIFTIIDETLDMTPRRLPMAVKPNAWPTVDGANGQILGANPAFDGLPPNYAYLDMGTNITKTAVRKAARTFLSVNAEAVVTGTARFRGCLDDLARTDLDLGDNIEVRGFDGADVALQIGRLSVDLDTTEGAYIVSATADERARDALSIDQILERNREALPDPARRPGNPGRSTRLVRDEGFSWDADSRCGKLVRTPLNGSTGLWVRKVIPFAEVGQLAGIRLHSTVPFAMMLMASLRYTPNMARNDVGNPFASSDPYRPAMTNLERFGFLASWGAQGDACGYSGGMEGDGFAFTGDFFEKTTLEYVTETPPFVAAFFFARDDDGFVWGFEEGDGFLPARQT